jgi:hypothetical protein
MWDHKDAVYAKTWGVGDLLLMDLKLVNTPVRCEEGLSTVVEPPAAAAKQFGAILENSWHPVLLPVSRREFHPVMLGVLPTWEQKIKGSRMRLFQPAEFAPYLDRKAILRNVCLKSFDLIKIQF